MKAFITGLLQGRRTRWSMLAAVSAASLVWAWPATAGEKQTVEIMAQYIAVNWGQASATPSGNIHVKGMGATAMMMSANPLVTGRLAWVGDWNGDAELNGGGAGTGVFEVGTWDRSSGVPVFIPSPTGGQWVTKWEMKGNPNGTYEGKVMGHGVAGEVEGMQFDLAGQGGGGVDYYSGQLLDPHAKASASHQVERPFKCKATVNWTVNMLDGSAIGHHAGVATHAGLWTSECSAIGDLANFVIVSATGVATTADGEQLFWKMTPDQLWVVQITGGTGRFQGATGAWGTTFFAVVASEVDPTTMTMTMTIAYTGEGTITY